MQVIFEGTSFKGFHNKLITCIHYSMCILVLDNNYQNNDYKKFLRFLQAVNTDVEKLATAFQSIKVSPFPVWNPCSLRRGYPA